MRIHFFAALVFSDLDAHETRTIAGMTGLLWRSFCQRRHAVLASHSETALRWGVDFASQRLPGN